MPGRTMAIEPQLKFYQKLILNRYLLTQFGVDSLKDLSAYLKNPSLEAIDDEGVTGFLKQLNIQFSEKCLIRQEDLARYDLNIVSHVRKINDKREEPMVLKYFQYLSLMFVEIYLDEYFNNRPGLLNGLNAYIAEFNSQYPDDAIAPYTDGDLNKIAVWNATGSGKTLIMQINYYQYQHYSGGRLPDDATYILLTPKEGLSVQHIEDFIASGISASIYDKSASRWGRESNEISVLENTKLGEKDQETIVSVKRFGNRNVVFVDEGHRGSSSGKEGKWQKFRDDLCSDGFSFEYSATFGQAIASSNDKTLSERYAKCIIFDYSYKYFYNDGYGKDYNIINLPDDRDITKRSKYLTACLMSFYQQKKLFVAQEREYAQFNVENPLFVFVGASVNAVRTEGGRKVSDVIDILLFFKDFISGTDSVANIERVLSGNTGLLDSANRDIFRNAFPYLIACNMAPEAIYSDVLKTVFNCNSAGAVLHIENLKGINGEIQLRLGENEPFGVINVGDDSALLGLCADNGFNTDSIDFSDSLFQGITKENSTINLLIGSKKFTEGWNCWRVSTMGLMNVGRSEGSEIIQLFGRGVRLKGCRMSLKRSTAYKKDFPETFLPKHISILETLNIFGVRADYMRQFKEFLEAEGVPSEKGQTIVLKMPVIRNSEYKKSGLYSLRVKGGVSYKDAAAKPILRYKKELPIVILDCYEKVQFESSQARGMGVTTKNETTLRPENIAFLNYDKIYSELLKYKTEKARHDVNILRKDIKDLLKSNSWYKLLIPDEELEVHKFEDYKRFENIVITLLKKYFDKFYYAEINRWEAHIVGYDIVEMNDDNENFLNEEKDEFSIVIDDTNENSSVIMWLRNVIDEVNKAKAEKRLISFDTLRQGDLGMVNIPVHLYNPLMYSANGNVEIGISPIALNENETKFVKDLQHHISVRAEYFSDKKIFLIRNRSKKGISFFEDKGFYPDFILWLVTNDKQYITFIDPHGMRNEAFISTKVRLYLTIKTEIESTLTEPRVILNSFILSPSSYSELVDKSVSIEKWNENHVLFMSDSEYVGLLFAEILN